MGPVSPPSYFVAGSVAPEISDPYDAYVNPGQDGGLNCNLTLGGGQFRWLLNGVTISNGEKYQGATSPWLRIILPQAEDLGPYTVEYTTACGVAIGGPAYLVPREVACPSRVADYDDSGGVDGSDVHAFLTDWAIAAPCADVNLDGGGEGQDVELWFISWCCASC